MRDAAPYNGTGSERGPVAFPVFKTGRCPRYRGRAGFDSQALPPISWLRSMTRHCDRLPRFLPEQLPLPIFIGEIRGTGHSLLLRSHGFESQCGPVAPAVSAVALTSLTHRRTSVDGPATVGSDLRTRPRPQTVASATVENACELGLGARLLSPLARPASRRSDRATGPVAGDGSPSSAIRSEPVR